MSRWFAVWVVLGFGCTGTDPEVEEAVATSGPGDRVEAEAAPGTTLTEFESEVLGDLLANVKEGVRPYTETSLGICPKHSDESKKRECEVAPERSPGELAPGEYILYSEWTVPNVGEKGTWKLKLETECVTRHVSKDGQETTSNRSSTKDYEVVYAGRERGYRLSPLRRITSPNSYGRVECTYKITNPHGDGDKVYEGSWIVPMGPTE